MDTAARKVLESFGRRVPGAIYIYERFPNGDSRVNYISEGIKAIYGYEPDELYENLARGHDRIHPDDRPAFEESIVRSFEKLGTWSQEYRVILPGIGVRHIAAAAELEEQESGSVVWFGHLLDVTDAKVAQQHLLEMAQRYQEAIEQIGDGAWFYDFEAGKLTMSAGWWQVLGFAEDGARQLADSWLDMAHPDDRDRVADGFNDLIREVIPSLKVEYRIRTKSGDYKWILARGVITERAADGAPKLAAGTYVDITERRESEWRLRLQAQVIEAAPVGVFVADATDDNLRVRYVNEAFCDVFSCTPEEILDASFGFTRGALDPDGMRKEFLSDIRLNRRSEKMWEFSHREGETSCNKFSTVPVALGGEQARIIGLVEDVTDDIRIRDDLVRAKEEAVAANVAKSNFIAHVSHELRTPLHGIMGLSELTACDADASEKGRKDAKEIYRAAEHLLRLISDVIDLSAIEAGRIALSVETHSLAALVDDVVRMARPVADEKNIPLLVDERLRAESYVVADGTRVRQILLNLVSNGVKYNEPNGFVTLRLLDESDEWMRIGVQDTGPGLDEDSIRRLFRPFDRLGRECSQIEGSGIGLVIAKGLAEAMGGSLGVESAPGLGSTFWVQLSRGQKEFARPSHPNDMSDPVAVVDARPVSAHILLAEDNVLSQSVFKSQLEKLGSSVDVVSDGREAWRRLDTKHYDMLITDVHMPGLDGYALTKMIRAAETASGCARTYIVGASANALKEAVRHATELGMDDYVTKPVTLSALEGVLQRWAATNTTGSQPTEARDREPTSQPLNGKTFRGAANSKDVDVVDRSVLEDIVGDDPSTIAAFVELFIETTREGVSELQKALEDKSLSQIENIAHKLKASARTVGATEFTNLCEEIERAAADGDREHVQSRGAWVERSFLEVVTAIESP